MTDEGRVERDVAVAAVLDLDSVTELLGKRKEHLVGGNVVGGSAGLVFSYLTPTTETSSRKEGFPPTDWRFLCRTEGNREGSIMATVYGGAMQSAMQSARK